MDKINQKRLEQLSAQDERLKMGSEDDRNFFAQHPERQYRVRIATPYEVAVLEIVGKQHTGLPHDMFWWSAIRLVAPGQRMRLTFVAPLPLMRNYPM
jgi:hypothetical protein